MWWLTLALAVDIAWYTIVSFSCLQPNSQKLALLKKTVLLKAVSHQHKLKHMILLHL